MHLAMPLGQVYATSVGKEPNSQHVLHFKSESGIQSAKNRFSRESIKSYLERCTYIYYSRLCMGQPFKAVG